tara:strand:+ start:198 stop:854 length:657 start_codon:yes stop_codon:yes gene_type:complete
MKSCCLSTSRTKKCYRLKDKKVFQLPRRFTKKKCSQFTKSKNKGFTIKSSCAPYQGCQKGGNKRKAIAKLTENPKIKGFITFEELETKKLKITYQVEGLTDGKHGFHIHEYGDLSEGCKSACAHFNPLHKHHGSLNSKERHAGDLGNIASKNNMAKGTIIAKDISLRDNKFNIVGRMVIIHQDEDDLGRGKGDQKEESLKTGNAGKRITCGVIGRMKS